MRRRAFFRGKKSGGSEFIFTINTANTSTGSSASNQIKLPLMALGVYDFFVDWGDGNSDNITVFNQTETTHTYLSSGTYTIKITGICKGFAFANSGDRLKILNVQQWGTLQFVNINNPLFGVFTGCSNLDVSATDIPDFSGVNQLDGFFNGCSSLIGNSSFNNWNTSGFNRMISWFQNATLFNQPLGNWDVSNCTSIQGLFRESSFNQNINTWNVSNVTDFRAVFLGTPFNQPLNNWDVGSATSFGSLNQGMFQSNTAFNQNIGSWRFPNCTSLQCMFDTATAFNNGGSPDINGWDVSSVLNFSETFSVATNFNQPIGSWDMSSATNLGFMFFSAQNFNQDIGSWNVSNVTTMSQMFRSAFAFDQNIGSWNVSNVTNFGLFLLGNTSLNTANMDLIYNGWSSRSVQPSITISFGNRKYTAASSAGRAILTGPPNNWAITDGGI